MEKHLPWNSKYVWRCPCCSGLNAWNWHEAERLEKLTKKPVGITYGSCFDNICHHCKANIVKPDSPILANCYTHEED